MCVLQFRAEDFKLMNNVKEMGVETPSMYISYKNPQNQKSKLMIACCGNNNDRARDIHLSLFIIKIVVEVTAISTLTFPSLQEKTKLYAAPQYLPYIFRRCNEQITPPVFNLRRYRYSGKFVPGFEKHMNSNNYHKTCLTGSLWLAPRRLLIPGYPERNDKIYIYYIRDVHFMNYLNLLKYHLKL
ncbi:hypothetical protein AGLY_008031 [Aphis glycines]|uniref:Uncharacterized protein n=1 Tax=Aphis glycines TaxID=307491 RepID=A0A6G0TKR6_APHGL|nr:hypothetical protein AGLY_008031 [Aphis glycines]